MSQWDFTTLTRRTTDQIFRKHLSELRLRGWELVALVEQELWGSYNHTNEAPVVTGHTTVAYLKRKREMNVLDLVPMDKLKLLLPRDVENLLKTYYS